MTQSPLQGYARGWFVVAYSSDIPAAGVRRLQYFGRELAAYRGESGEAFVLDAYCPHLGAHLAVGGVVVDDTLQCPFHGWRFDGGGQCVSVPYAKKIPPRAHTRCWHVRERNDLVFLWHEPDGGEPDWEIPVLHDHASDGWTAWDGDCLLIATQPREIVENVADKAHFPMVHGTHVEAFDNIYEGHMATQITTGTAYPRGGGKDTFSLRATYFGPGYQITEMGGYMASRLLLAHTPIDEETLHLRFGVSLERRPGVDDPESFSKAYIENLRTGFHEDIQIWEHKLYRDRPALCDGDGPIGKLRKWYSQFYG